MKGEDARLREVVSWLSSGGKTDVKRARALAARDRSRNFRRFPEAFLTGEGNRFATLATKKLTDARPDLLQYSNRSPSSSLPPRNGSAPPMPHRWPKRPSHSRMRRCTNMRRETRARRARL
jgi:hypothetical protein